jgi:hypothetical protein
MRRKSMLETPGISTGDWKLRGEPGGQRSETLKGRGLATPAAGLAAGADARLRLYAQAAVAGPRHQQSYSCHEVRMQACPFLLTIAPEEQPPMRSLLGFQPKQVHALVGRAAARDLVIRVAHQHLHAPPGWLAAAGRQAGWQTGCTSKQSRLTGRPPHLGQRALARPVLAHDGVHLALPHCQRDALQDFLARGGNLGAKVLHFEQDVPSGCPDDQATAARRTCSWSSSLHLLSLQGAALPA